MTDSIFNQFSALGRADRTERWTWYELLEAQRILARLRRRGLRLERSGNLLQAWPEPDCGSSIWIPAVIEPGQRKPVLQALRTINRRLTTIGPVAAALCA